MDSGEARRSSRVATARRERLDDDATRQLRFRSERARRTREIEEVSSRATSDKLIACTLLTIGSR